MTMFVGRVVLMLNGIIILFFYQRKPTGREFFLPVQTLMGKAVKLLRAVFFFSFSSDDPRT
jgi:hypothetical protein